MLVELERTESVGLGDALRTAAGLVPLKTLRLSFLEHLFQQAAMRTLYAGQVLFEQGCYDKSHVYVLHGQVELEGAQGFRQIISGGDTAFSLAQERPRGCRAVARTDCTLLSIDSELLDQALCWSQIADYLLSKIATKRDYDEDAAWMQTVLNSNLFLKVPPVNVEQIFSRLKPVVVLKGDVVVRQGEIGDCCYFIKEGRARVSRYGAGDRRPRHVADIGVGRCFGEDALVYDAVRNANVTMTSDGVLMRLEKKDFLLLLREPRIGQVGLEELRSPEPPTLIDVRTDDEYGAGHLERAANIPLHLLCLKKRLLVKDRPYVFYCDTGRRSRAAAYLLASEGYNTAALEGGLQGSGSTRDLVCVTDYMLRNGQLVDSL